MISQLRFFLYLGILLSGALSFATPSSVFKFPQGQVELLSEGTQLGLYFKLAPEWHIYWKNSGDSGAAPKWEWSLSQGQIHATHWPLPERIVVAGLTNFGYADEALFLFDVETAEPNQHLTAHLKIEFLICKVECIPYFTELQKQVLLTDRAGPLAALMTRFSYPSSENSGWMWRMEKQTATTLQTVLIPPSSLKDQIRYIEIFPEDGESFQSTVPTLEIGAQGYLITHRLQDSVQKDLTGSHFWVVWEDHQGRKAGQELILQKVVPASLALILFWAFLGGLILNVMPCVFPVLSIKILSFLGPEKQASALRRSGLFYTAGVVLSFCSLGGLLLLLRAGGEQIGWGFQLQSPLVTAGISLLFFWLGLNFLGLFEIGQSFSYVGARKTSSSDAGSFFTGVLAVIVATPCTAPFMGAALGASLTLPPAHTLLIFAGLGFGMAVPFLILAYVPYTLRFLPKPGMWMQKLKEFLAFPLFATVLWLLWVLAQQRDVTALLFVLALFLSVGLWIWSVNNLRSERGKQFSLLGGFLLSFALLIFLPEASSTSSVKEATSAWQGYTPEKIQSHLAAGESVFVDFTAAWCITCQVNKKWVLNTPEILTAFQKKNIQLYRADWTDKNPMITEELAKLGRNSLPVYVFYRKGRSTPEFLPEILTKGMIIDLLNKEEKP
ncbi:MAG: thioredoxin family protein [Bdellovibrio sp.]